MPLQAAYANLYATVQGLLSRTEKSVADLTDFNRMRAEFDEWFRRANGTAQDAAQGSAKGAAIKDRVDQGHNSMALFDCQNLSLDIQIPCLRATGRIQGLSRKHSGYMQYFHLRQGSNGRKAN